jgi:hypothetical protein
MTKTTRADDWRLVYRKMTTRELDVVLAAFHADRARAVGAPATIEFCDERIAFIRDELIRRNILGII